MDINSHIWKTIEQIEGKVKPWWRAQAARFSNSERFVLGPSVKAAASHSLLQISVIPSNKGWNQAATLSMVPLFLAFSRQPIKTVHSTHGAWSMLRYIEKKKQNTGDVDDSSRFVGIIPPDTETGHLLLVIFCRPSTSSGVITVFLRSSSSVLTGIPMSDELQPCCTFMSRVRRLLAVGVTIWQNPGFVFFSPPLYWSRRRRRRGSRLTCVGRSL